MKLPLSLALHLFVVYLTTHEQVSSTLVEVSRAPDSSSPQADEYKNIYDCVLDYNVFEHVKNFQNLHRYVSLMHKELSDSHHYCFSVLAQASENILAYKLYEPWIVVREKNVANRSVDILVSGTHHPHNHRIGGGEGHGKLQDSIVGKSDGQQPIQVQLPSASQIPSKSSEESKAAIDAATPIKVLSKRSLLDPLQKKSQQQKPIAEALSPIAGEQDKIMDKHDKIKPQLQQDALKPSKQPIKDAIAISSIDEEHKHHDKLEPKCDGFRKIAYGQAIGQGEHWEHIMNVTRKVFDSLQPGVDVGYQTVTDRLSEEIGKHHHGIGQTQWSVVLQSKSQDLISYQFQDDAYWAIWEYKEFSIVAWASSCRV